MKNFIFRMRRFWAAVSQPGSGGLEQPGDWQCLYPDGFRTRYMSYGDADNCRRCWGGRLRWRHDPEEKS